MAKQSAPQMVKQTTSKNSKKATPAKKVAKNTKITSIEALRQMTVGDLEQAIKSGQIDLDKVVNYKADTYFVKADKSKQHPKEAWFCPLTNPVGEKTHKFIGQTDAVAIGQDAIARPLEHLLSEVAYVMGNPYI